jgi:hypothetical protein
MEIYHGLGIALHMIRRLIFLENKTIFYKDHDMWDILKYDTWIKDECTVTLRDYNTPIRIWCTAGRKSVRKLVTYAVT